ncbi:MAG: hypothetical protein J5860_04980 [Clostridia bacterium]|nr:hypothetical protein [Clostridia bacterium]
MSLLDSIESLKEALGPEYAQYIDAYMDMFIILVAVVGAVIGIAVIGFIVFIVVVSSRNKKMKNSYQKLEIGMSRDDVVAMLGSPNDKGAEEGGIDILIWRNRIGTRSRTITVKIKDGRVCSYTSENM